MKVTVLGCGSSSGTPAVDWGWGCCAPDNPRNRRLRPSILVEDDKTRLLVDTSPDLRQQLLNTGVKKLDAVLFTHYHADHLHGIDDLRPINRAMNGPLDVFADTATLDVIKERFGYVFGPLAEDAKGYHKPTLIPHTLKGGERFTIGSIEISVFVQDHGFCDTLGFRFGPIAYSTDVMELPDYAFGILDGIDVWLIGVLADKPHPTHAHVSKTLDWARRARSKRTILTHLSPNFDYAKLAARLPDGVEPAYDGMVIEA